MSGGAVREWPLIGRGEEIGAIEAGYRRSGVQGMILTGARGAGKSRVAREAMAGLGRGGSRVAWIGARPAMRSMPFSAIAPMAPGVVDGFALLSRLISDLRSAGPGRMVLVADDVHLLDEESAAVLAELAVRRLVFLIGTVAPGGRVPDAFAALWSSGRLVRLPIRPLPANAMHQLLDRLFGADLDAISRGRLARATGGNPLALRALMDAGLPSLNALCSSGGFAQADTALDSLGSLVHGLGFGMAGQWLDEAGPVVREVIEIVACAEPMPVRLLEKMIEPAAIDAAEQSGMLRVADDPAGPAARLEPPLSAPLVRFLLTYRATRRVYGMLATTVLQGPPLLDEDEDVLRAGRWQLGAGTVTAPEYLAPAARQAMERFDLELAASLAAAARASRPGPAADLLLARVLLRQGRGRRAAEALPPKPSEDPEGSTAWALTTAEIQYFVLGEPAYAAERTLRKVIRDRGQAEAKRSWIQLADGRGPEALSTAQAVLRSPDAGPQAKIWAVAAGTAAAGLLGRGALSEALFQQGSAMAAHPARDRFPWGAAQVGYGACLARLLCGDIRQAQGLADQGYAAAVAADARSMAGIWAALRGMAAKAQGRVRSAAGRLREALALSEGEELFCLRTAWMAELAAVTAMAGDAAQARGWLARADGPDACHTDVLEPWIALGRAWSCASVGELSRAGEFCRRAAEASRTHGHLAHEAIALYDAARLGAAGAVHARLAELAHTMEGDTVAVMAMAAQGLAHRDGDALGQATDAFDRLGHTLLAAETATAASHARHLAGREAAAALLQERADWLAQRCEGARTPLLDRWRLRSLLTPREREVVLLASASTTPQIAARLGLSPRTVSNYLQRAYDKLGLTGRADLRVFLGARPASAGAGVASADRGSRGAGGHRPV